MSKKEAIKNIETIKKIKEFYLSNQNYRDLLLFLLSINTGLKMKALLNLNVGDVKQKESINITSGKQIFLNDEIKNLINQITLNSDNSEPLFKSRKGGRLERTTVFRNFKNVFERLMLNEDLSLSSLTKTFKFHYYLKMKEMMLNL